MAFTVGCRISRGFGPGSNVWGGGGDGERSIAVFYTKMILLTTIVGANLIPARSAAIRASQLGYLPAAPKIAMLSEAPTGPVVVRRARDGKAVFTVIAGPPKLDPDSGDTLRIVDFSALKTPGDYVLDAPGLGRSDPFGIGKDVDVHAFRLAVRAFTGQRAGTDVSLAPDYPQFHYEAGHTAPAQYDPSSGKSGTRDVSGGWYDAGDYGRYVVNSGITTGTLLWAFELYGPKILKQKLDIPNANPKIPAYLAEVKWNLDWMLKMQDDDGGVWHKATTANFSGFVMPKDDKAPMLVVGTGFAPYKNTTATADLAAVAAIAARIYGPYDPAYAARCLVAARKAWTWVEANPNVLYRDNPNGISTGGYGDGDARDERLWAGAELFRTTGEKGYGDATAKLAPEFHLDSGSAQGWGSVANLGLYTLAFAKGAEPALVARIRAEAVRAADGIAARIDANGYRVPLTSKEYYWGSNSVVANYGMMLLFADRIKPDAKYRNAAQDCLHYLLGRNTFATSFVTGVGTHSPLHPHHRPSGADGIDQPWPGLLVGGPNADGKTLPCAAVGGRRGGLPGERDRDQLERAAGVPPGRRALAEAARPERPCCPSILATTSGPTSGSSRICVTSRVRRRSKPCSPTWRRRARLGSREWKASSRQGRSGPICLSRRPFGDSPPSMSVSSCLATVKHGRPIGTRRAWSSRTLSAISSPTF